MNERDRSLLGHMLTYARRAQRALGSQSLDDLLADEKSQLAVERAIEIVGEAARKVSDEAKAPIDLPWEAIIHTRHILAHGYVSIDYRI